MTATLAGVHYPTCEDASCVGCYPDVRPAPKPVRGRGPKRNTDGLSADQARTKKNRELIERGIHPATRFEVIVMRGEQLIRWQGNVTVPDLQAAVDLVAETAGITPQLAPTEGPT